MTGACGKCKTGYVVDREDQYGRYRSCVNCGWQAESERATSRSGVDSLLEFTGSRTRSPSYSVQTPLGPYRRVWSRFFNQPRRRYPRPNRCIWPECYWCGDSSQCCMTVRSAVPLCARHTSLFTALMHVPPPTWAEMALPEPFGVVTVEYVVERSKSVKLSAKAWAMRVTLPTGRFPHGQMVKNIRSAFYTDTGYRLEWLNDAVEATVCESGKMPALAR